MNVKLPFILCFFYSAAAIAQSNYTTTGIFSFLQPLPVPSEYEAGPGQLTKDGAHFILGLTSGDFENQEEMNSNIYSYNLKATGSTPSITSYNLPNAEDSVRYFQCSASNGERAIVFVVNAYGGWSDNQLGTAEKISEGKFGNVRPLTEANDDELSDAYPWLSGDGLKLYFSRNFILYYAERNSLSDKFSTPVPVKYLGDVNLEIVSCWLTPNEKIMYFISNNNIYKCTRKNLTSAFSFPELYTTEFKDFYFIAGLSFMPDKKTMFIYYSDESTQQILKYKLKKGKAW
ncbi:MAG: hypothetical protein ACHQFW_04545 [Chitinophagales bacterium]